MPTDLGPRPVPCEGKCGRDIEPGDLIEVTYVSRAELEGPPLDDHIVVGKVKNPSVTVQHADCKDPKGEYTK